MEEIKKQSADQAWERYYNQIMDLARSYEQKAQIVYDRYQDRDPIEDNRQDIERRISNFPEASEDPVYSKLQKLESFIRERMGRTSGSAFLRNYIVRKTMDWKDKISNRSMKQEEYNDLQQRSQTQLYKRLREESVPLEEESRQRIIEFHKNWGKW